METAPTSRTRFSRVRSLATLCVAIGAAAFLVSLAMSRPQGEQFVRAYLIALDGPSLVTFDQERQHYRNIISAGRSSVDPLKGAILSNRPVHTRIICLQLLREVSNPEEFVQVVSDVFSTSQDADLRRYCISLLRPPEFPIGRILDIVALALTDVSAEVRLEAGRVAVQRRLPLEIPEQVQTEMKKQGPEVLISK